MNALQLLSKISVVLLFTPALSSVACAASNTLVYSPGVIAGTKGIPISPIAPSYRRARVIANYRVSGTLPAGLSLNSSTGVISGTPTVLMATTPFLITASTSSGNLTATVPITISDIAPFGLKYSLSAASYTVGTPIVSNSPSASGGAITSYAVSPALPSGLRLDTTTGVISGSPTLATAPANYVVTATNTGGSTSATLSITVASAPVASPVSPAANTYYIDPNGDDSTGDGSQARPWKSLYKATTAVQTPGSLIHINAGTYVENHECLLAPGVSLQGEGPSSVIQATFQTSNNQGGYDHASIALVSEVDGTNGNQSISQLTLDGVNLTGSIAIAVKCRSNVKIHDVTIRDFYVNGVSFIGASGGSFSQPKIYASGNELYNSKIINCGDTDGTWDGGADIQWAGQIDLLVHDNYFDNTARAPGHNGCIVNASYYMKGTKYYNNTSYKPSYDGDDWNFHIESWNNEGGMEIYNNKFYGGDTVIDVAGVFNTKGNYPYSTSIHDNFFTDTPTQTAHGKYAVAIEATTTDGVLIYANHFLNIVSPVGITDGGSNTGIANISNINIYKNVMENSGWNDPTKFDTIIQVWPFSPKGQSVFSNISIDSNVILSNPISHMTAIDFEVTGKVTNLSVRNNIIMGCTNGNFMFVTDNGVIDGLAVDNNILYQNSGSNLPLLRGTQTASHYEFLNNINADPRFVSSTDFHLQSTSPGINAGALLGLPYSGSAPDIGAYESAY